MPEVAPADSALVIWLLVDHQHPGAFSARLTTSRGLDPAPYERFRATDVESVCRFVRSWLEGEVRPPAD